MEQRQAEDDAIVDAMNRYTTKLQFDNESITTKLQATLTA